MAKNIIGFNSESDFDRMSRSVTKSENMQQVGQRQRSKYPVNGGGGVKIVRAEMQSIDCGMVGNALVLSRPCGLGKVPGEDDSGEIKVFDRTGEFILDSSIVGKQIYAAYLKSDYLGTGTTHEDTLGITQPCQWEIFKVCTPGTSNACEPPDEFPASFDFDSTNASGACQSPAHGKTVDYVSDNGCIATYYHEFTSGAYTIELTFTYGCDNGSYVAELYYHQYGGLSEDYEQYWTSSSITESTDPIGLFPGSGTCGSPTGYILANKG